MEIRIYSAEKGEMKEILSSNYSYSENQSTQEKRPSFFISTSEGKNSGYEIHFHAKNVEEIETFIKDLEEIKNEIKKLNK